MVIILKLGFTLLLILTLLFRRVNLGHTMLIGATSIYLLNNPSNTMLITAVRNTIWSSDTWVIILAMFFVMCLEYQFRTNGILTKFMDSLNSTLKSDRILLPLMPALLGLLPSIGGAVFSAPLVESTSSRFKLSGEHKTAINYWFRHVWEFINPIGPSLLFASSIAGIQLSVLISNQLWITLLALIIGWFVLVSGNRFKKTQLNTLSTALSGVEQPIKDDSDTLKNILLAIGPILTNIILITVFDINAAVSITMVVFLMGIVLKQDFKDIVKMLVNALNFKLHWSIFSILFFQQMLLATGITAEIVTLFKLSGLTVPVIVSLTAFLIGLLTGVAQGMIAIVFPIVAAMAPGELSIITLSLVAGTAGQMLSPAHLCLVVTADYFKANLVRSLVRILIMETLMFACVYLVFSIFRFV
ncbi:MAG: DUF401 family protein [Desulfitobacterium hafniense]|nr:DUF401 family protein [Desulfitobacterium hafniense]